MFRKQFSPYGLYRDILGLSISEANDTIVGDGRSIFCGVLMCRCENLHQIIEALKKYQRTRIVMKNLHNLSLVANVHTTQSTFVERIIFADYYGVGTLQAGYNMADKIMGGAGDLWDIELKETTEGFEYVLVQEKNRASP